METIVEKKLCTGCTSCKNICPKNAISMVSDNNGFKYPEINDKCIDCKLCQKKCSVLCDIKKNDTLNCYLAYSNNQKLKKNSSSGGIFSELANVILDNKGLVIGAGFINNKLQHIVIDNKDDLKKIQGSKYIQSDLKDTFNFIKSNLDVRQILFVGVPCQVAGLKAYLGKEYKNLITVDLFCHGVPSQKMFDKYIDELEKNNKDEVINYNFRDKITGWEEYSHTVTFKNKKISEININNDYMKLYLKDIALRESCYNCKFKIGNKHSDITLGDFWGVKNYYPDIDREHGISAVIINSESGKELFDSISDNIYHRDCKLSEILNGNPSLVQSSKLTKNRDNALEDLDNISFDKCVEKYCKKEFIIKRVLRKIKNIIFKLGNLNGK